MTRLEELYNIKQGNQYIVKFTDNTIVKGTILEFNPSVNMQIIIKTDEGLVINQIHEIIEMKPAKEEKSKYKIGDKVRFKNILLDVLVSIGAVTDIYYLDIQGEIYYITTTHIYFIKDDYMIQNVQIEGNVGSVSCGGSVDVVGDVNGDIDCGGSVSVKGQHSGSIDCGGSVSIR